MGCQWGSYDHGKCIRYHDYDNQALVIVAVVEQEEERSTTGSRSASGERGRGRGGGGGGYGGVSTRRGVAAASLDGSRTGGRGIV